MDAVNERIYEIVARQASARAILHRFDIDPGAHAAETVAEACAKLQLSFDQVLERLEEARFREQKTGVPDVSSYSVTRLIQHVVRVHHRYIREQLPALIAQARDLRETQAALALDDAVSLLEALRSAMLAHFEDEEQVLFPYIAKLDDDARLAQLPPHSGMRGLAHGVFVMVQEHESVAHLLDLLEDRTHGFSTPDGASPACSSLFAGMRAFKLDLERHLELENAMLFPRALELEAASGRLR